jgi:hypothetical protein
VFGSPSFSKLDAIVDFADWLTSPFRPVWGDYKEDGMRDGNPCLRLVFSPTYALIWSVKTPTIGNAFHLKDLNIATGFNPLKNVYESFPTNPKIFANAKGICKDFGVS